MPCCCFLTLEILSSYLIKDNTLSEKSDENAFNKQARTEQKILYCISKFFGIIFLSYIILFGIFFPFPAFESLGHPTRLASLLSGGNCTVPQLSVNIMINDE